MKSVEDFLYFVMLRRSQRIMFPVLASYVADFGSGNRYVARVARSWVRLSEMERHQRIKKIQFIIWFRPKVKIFDL